METSSTHSAQTRRSKTVGWLRFQSKIALAVQDKADFDPVVDQSERVIASNVFSEKDFPQMSLGRIVLLGDGMSQDLDLCSLSVLLKLS